MYLQTLNLEWGQIDPKGNRRVKMLQHLTIWNLFRWAFGFMLLTQNWTSSKLFWYLIGNFIWICLCYHKSLHLACLPPYSCLICFYVRLPYVKFGSAAGSNRWCGKHCIMGSV